MRYEAILFDADETLFDFVTSERNAITAVLAELGIGDADAPDRYHAINADCWRAFERGEITQPQLKLLRFERLLAPYGGLGPPSHIAARYEEALGAQSILLPGAYETVAEIAARRPVAIVTNGIARVQRARMARSAILPFISALVISEEVGAAKPDPKMVFEALRLLGGVSPDRALLIGDSLTSDMRAARSAGVDACWYNPKGAARPNGMVFAHEIRSIEESIEIALAR